MTSPELSIVIPTFNNADVLRRCLESWQVHAADQPVEIIVIEDGCRDRTRIYLETLTATPWGQTHLRWHHEADLHELRCTNRGLKDARAPLAMAWQDDMFVRHPWFVPELLATFAQYKDLGLLCLSRGLNCYPALGRIERWEDLTDFNRLQSTIGPRPLNWFLIQEVDIVIRPWVVRKSCLESVGYLDEAFVPTEWDEADLCFRIRQAGWRIATHGYERLGAYSHLGSTTLGRELSDKYKQQVLRNGLLFHERWDDAIREGAHRRRKTWLRKASAAAWRSTASRAARALVAERGHRTDAA